MTAIVPITGTHLFTAACLWEAAMDAMDKGRKEDEAIGPGKQPPAFYSFHRKLHCYRVNVDTAALREQVVGLSVSCDLAWDALGEKGQDEIGCFDWEFVPRWLEQNFFKLTRGW